MKNNLKYFYRLLFFLIIINLFLISGCKESKTGKEVYLKHCSSCHHPERFGISAPPLLPETLANKKDNEILDIIKNGLLSTNMKPFNDKLNDNEILSIIKFIRTPGPEIKWGTKEIQSSKNIPETKALAIKPNIDMLNLFMIVEGGKGLVHFMDGDTFNLLDNVYVGAIHGGPKFDSEMHNAYLGGRAGWVVKYSLVDWKDAGRIRVGINTRNIAISPDGKLLAAANTLPESIVIVNPETMEPVKVIDAPGTPSAVYSLKKGNAFIVCFRNNPELWFINYNDLSLTKAPVDQPFSDFFIGPDEKYFIGAARKAKHMSIFDISKKKVTKTVNTVSMPHLASAALWNSKNKEYAAFPHIGSPTLTVVEINSWKVLKNIQLKGSGFFARTHENIDHIWADSNTNTIELINKKTLKKEFEVTPDNEKKAMHIEFTKNGDYALVSIWEKEGGIVIYDTKTLQEIKRIPLVKPVGKYNATNKKY
ncbi:MAG: nitrite reductase [Spirochaetia bacterium]|nr:nitrite reductase [Spirochaetia bacterium]